MMRFLSQMMKLPLAAFVYGMEVLTKMMRDVQRTANLSIDTMANEFVQTLDGASEGEVDLTSDKTIDATDGAVSDSAQTIHKEERKMPDTNLSDDMLKLVRYKVLFIKRDYEVAFPEVEEVVADNMTDTAYTAWKVAEFIQHLGDTEVPIKKWGGGKDQQVKPKYPKHPKYKNGTWVIEKLDEEDKKYLRVYFEVLERYEREKFKHQERQIEVLEEIRDRISKT